VTLDQALQFDALGLSLIPLKERSKEPEGEWKSAQSARPTSAELHTLFGNCVRRNGGIVTGAISGVVVIESDTPEAETWIAANLPPTPMMTRSARGLHHFYRLPSGPWAGEELPASIVIRDDLKIEVKRDGQYVVAPGSVHPSGHIYTEVQPWPTSLDAVPEFPFTEIARLTLAQPTTQKRSEPLPSCIPAGARNNTLFSTGCKMRRFGCQEPELLAALLEINRTRCQPPESEATVRHIVHSVLRYKPGVDENVAPEIRLVRLADVQPEAVSWVWHPYVPVGKVTLIEGDPGIGKSYLSLALATSISLGRGLPGLQPQEPATVLLLSAEDGLGDTIRPRLDAMGADVRRIFAIDGAVSLDGVGRFAIEEQITRIKPTIVFIDPFVAYIGAKVDLHKANETRTVLAALAAIAERNRCAVVLIRHLTKGSRDKSIYRGLGSIDITAACRSVLLVGADADDPNTRALVQVKSNLAPFGPARGYVIREGRFEWTAGVSDLTAHRILAAESETGPKAEAVDFLREALADGPMLAADVLKHARKVGISEMTLRRAKAELKVRSKAIRERGVVKGWELSLPLNDDLPLQEVEP
jgi:hypothetical protein